MHIFGVSLLTLLLFLVNFFKNVFGKNVNALSKYNSVVPKDEQMCGVDGVSQQVSPFYQTEKDQSGMQIYIERTILSNDGHKIILWKTAHKIIF